jgi:uncharacterized protein YbbC (DUF1343 family)
MNFSSKLLLLSFAIFGFFQCKAQPPKDFDFENMLQNSLVYTGADNKDAYLPLIKGKKIGILTNQTGIVKDIDSRKNYEMRKSEIDNQVEVGDLFEVKIELKHLVDFLIENEVNVQKIYAPEHGFRGTADAGELIKDGKDTKTGLPIISLYGNNKKPTPEQLSGIDVMVFDLQDVGVRFYTYISSLHYLMEACSGNIVDGPTLEMENKSFVGMHPIPVLHGMTIGEYAKMINGEKWLNPSTGSGQALQCELTVVECLNYDRNKPYSLPVKPSPNLPNDKSINLYASLCFFEGTNVSVGRGTEKQFQIFGSPFLKNMDFSFTPKPNLGAKDPLHNGKLCYGRDLTEAENVNRLELKWLIEAYQNTPDKTKFFNNFFVKLAGTKKLQQQIEQGLSEEEIRKSWEKDLEAFEKIREKYLIYK